MLLKRIVLRQIALWMVLGLIAAPTWFWAQETEQEAHESGQESEKSPAVIAAPRPAYLISAEGPVDGPLSNRIRKALAKAAEAEAEVVIIKIDTFGGDLDAAVKIRDAILESKFKTIGYIDKRAISAGALIALATHEIVVAPGATIGAAAPLRMTWSGPKEAGEKIVSYVRKEMKATAESRNHPAELAEAMVDTDVEIEGVIEKGKLLTLTTKEALELKLASAEVETLEALLEKYNLQLSEENMAEVQEADEERGWFDEFQTWHGWVIIGLILVVAEMLIPSFFLLWFGIGAFVAAFLAYLESSMGVQFGGFLATSLLLLIFSRTIFKSRLLESPAGTPTNVDALVGQKGIVTAKIEGALKPGNIKVAGQNWAAVCDDDADAVIEKDAIVEVLEVVGNKVRVKSA